MRFSKKIFNTCYFKYWNSSTCYSIIIDCRSKHYEHLGALVIYVFIIPSKLIVFEKDAKNEM